jgi:hypothetical protein
MLFFPDYDVRLGFESASLIEFRIGELAMRQKRICEQRSPLVLIQSRCKRMFGKQRVPVVKRYSFYRQLGVDPFLFE